MTGGLGIVRGRRVKVAFHDIRAGVLVVGTDQVLLVELALLNEQGAALDLLSSAATVVELQSSMSSAQAVVLQARSSRTLVQ
jgi:hypothetical protein